MIGACFPFGLSPAAAGAVVRGADAMAVVLGLTREWVVTGCPVWILPQAASDTKGASNVARTISTSTRRREKALPGVPASMTSPRA